jgi:hypothetical protein
MRFKSCTLKFSPIYQTRRTATKRENKVNSRDSVSFGRNSGGMTLLMPREVDRKLRYPRGRALRLARSGRIPFIRLPDGEIRFDETEIEKLLKSEAATNEPEVAHVQ